VSSDLSRLDPELDGEAATCRAIVETPKGGRGKLTYDPKSGAFTLKRLLPEGMSFPLDFGFVPGTRAEDGDPIDILVLNDEPSAIGTLMSVRLIGVIEAEQTQDGETVRNDRLIAVASVSHLFARVGAVEDLGPRFLEHLTAFWENYNALRGAGFKVLAIGNAEAAVRRIEAALA
jgi:inorganic pyrophosphatase